MRPFNILDRNVNLSQNTLLEASAGTGKTFSIEHLVVRLLITGETPPVLSSLLAVTFTRAATRDLKMRIRQNMVAALDDLRKNSTQLDYLQELLEKGHGLRSQKRLENALACFDQAHIYTIHGFCLRMLKEHGFLANIRVDMPDSESSLTTSEVLDFIKDFFRTEFNEEHYRLSEIKAVWRLFKNSSEEIQEELLVRLNGKEIVKPLYYQEAFTQFKEKMHCLEGFTSSEMFQQIPNYKGLCDRSGKVKPEVQKQLEAFAAVVEKGVWTEREFDRLISDQLSVLQLFANPKSNAAPWRFVPHLKELYPLVSAIGIWARIAYDCQQRFYHYLKQTEKFRFDDLLEMMQSALKHPAFISKVQAQFSVAIIDEFQDTDPIQWAIFREIFLKKGHQLFLVGDPKQSIYAFRQADIYTYLQAADDLGEQNLSSLTTNYRSQTSLIRALNTLFSKPGFLPLPKRKSYLPYREIQPSPNAMEYPFKDGKGSVHFASFTGKYALENVEQTHFFPYFVEEIQRLVEQENMKYSQIAILISDRFQAARLVAYLQKWQIPVVNQKQKSLLDSTAYLSMKELIQAVVNPKDASAIKIALGGPIFGWTHERIKNIELMEVMRFFYQQHQTLINEGFGPFFTKLITSPFFSEKSLSEQIVSREEGDQFYHELHQIAEILIKSQAPAEQLLQTLERLQLKENDEDTTIRPTPHSNAIKVLTVHSSKGLEFDVVIALGLVKRKKIEDTLIPWQNKLIPVFDEESEQFLKYCEEINAEKMRQLYVALTRAKYRVYLPVINAPFDDPQNCSPMDLFLKLNPLSELSNDGITLTELSGDYALHKIQLEENLPLLLPPPTVDMILPTKKIASFSSLAQRVESDLPLESFVETEHTMPLGSQTGNLLHLLLEKLPLSQAFHWTLNDFERFIFPFIEHTAYQEWLNILSNMLYKAINIPLFGSFALRDINPDYTMREMEFLYPEEKMYGISHLKGFVDLFFQHEGKYYLLDWKSNWLGSTVDAYHRDSLEQCMLTHDYFLQAKIYTNALKKYLALVDSRPFDEIFGGVYYVFLRGICETNHKLGVFFTA